MDKRLSIKKQLQFFESLNALLQNGFSIGEAIKLISELHVKDQFIDNIINQLNAGESFANGLINYIPVDIVNQIEIAEQHGQLVNTLQSIQKFIEERNKQRTKLNALLIYPFFLVGLLMIIIVGIKLFVSPQLSMIGGSDSIKNNGQIWWWLLLPLFCGSLICFGMWLRQQTRIKRAEFYARVPIIGGIIQSYYAYFFASNISLLMASGLEARSIATVLKRFQANSILFEIGRELELSIQSGRSINSIIERHAFLPNEAGLFFDHGDQAQLVAKKLAVYSKLSFDKMWNQSQRLISIVQPVIFVVIGAVIVITYLNMLLPMYDTLSEVYK